ncbi:MAG: SIS domain-containing protein [Okeania sp. SIO2D1]|nr:SIS domain-containing protein [Okeania sp. SIO2D1]
MQAVASIYADALEHGGLVHVYANGHSRLAVEEMVIRMGALTGFHAILSVGLATFTDVVGANGIRVNQEVERVEGLGEVMLNEYDIGPHDALLAISATGTTVAAVDMALAFNQRYPDHPLIALCSREWD